MSVAKSSLRFSLGTILSRATGLVRDSVLTGVFGASSSLDAFIVANRIPNLFRDMLAEGALAGAFTKVYAELSETDPQRAQALFKNMLYLATVLLVIISLLGFIAAPYLVRCFTLWIDLSKRPPSFIQDAVTLTRVLFPFLGFAVLSSIVMGVLHQSGRFFYAALAPTMLNVGYIVGALVLAPLTVYLGEGLLDVWLSDLRVLGLAMGVLLGGILHFTVQLVAVVRLNKSADLSLEVRNSNCAQNSGADLRRVGVIMLPAMIAASAGSINVLINTNFATSLPTGAVSWLNFAFRLVQLPVGLFGVAVGVAVLPALTRHLVQANNEVSHQAVRELVYALELILWLSVPCVSFLLVNNLSCVELLFQHGRFTAYDAQQTASALFVYSFAIVGYGFIKVLSSFYYAIEKTTYAMKVSLIGVALNFLLNCAFVKSWGHVGLAAASSMTLSINALWLIKGLSPYAVLRQGKPELVRAFIYLGLAFILSIILQKICLEAVSTLDWANIKLRAIIDILCSLLVTSLIFAGFAMHRLKWGWQDVVKQIKNFI